MGVCEVLPTEEEAIVLRSREATSLLPVWNMFREIVDIRRTFLPDGSYLRLYISGRSKRLIKPEKFWWLLYRHWGNGLVECSYNGLIATVELRRLGCGVVFRHG